MNVAGTAGNENTPLFTSVLVPPLMEAMPIDSATGLGAAEEAREPLLDDGHGRGQPGRSTGVCGVDCSLGWLVLISCTG